MRSDEKSIFDIMRDWSWNKGAMPELLPWQKQLILQYMTGKAPMHIKGSQHYKDFLRKIFGSPTREPSGASPEEMAEKKGNIQQLSQLIKAQTAFPIHDIRGKVMGYHSAPPKDIINTILAVGAPEGMHSRAVEYLKPDWSGSSGGIVPKSRPEYLAPRTTAEKYLRNLWGKTIGGYVQHLMTESEKGGSTDMGWGQGFTPWQFWSPEQRRLAEMVAPGLHRESEIAHLRRLGASAEKRGQKGPGFLGSLMKFGIQNAPTLLSKLNPLDVGWEWLEEEYPMGDYYNYWGWYG